MKRARLCTLLLVLAAAPCFGGAIYDVKIDTTSLPPGTAGFIDLAFNGGYPATAVISGFTNVGGSLNAGTITTFGTVAGTLPATVTMSDDNADYDEGLSFGSSIEFMLNLSGTPSGTIGNVFTLSFFNSTFDGALLTGNVSDFWLAQWQMDTAGNTTFTAFDNPSGGTSFATVTPTPEPGNGLLVIAGISAAFFWGRRARRKPAA